MTTISSGWQQLAFNMPSIRAEAILPNPRNPKVMCEREVIRLPAGCKGEANGRMGEWACRRRARRGVDVGFMELNACRQSALSCCRSVGSQPPKGFRED